jgi:hypothetical protein
MSHTRPTYVGSRNWRWRMSSLNTPKRPLRCLLLGLGILMTTGLTGCQMDIGGVTHPSPYYMSDDVQYFPPGSEMKLSREANALKEAKAQQVLQQR